ncbi:hypothetical protein J3R75_003734 [Oligosphaera ethanolica]|uniref:Uncharacterized protein n=1 Tax=Oligosphaera ethanolica TaxID=760260 RepID=A0AAE4ARL4_9BACT|nr:hypothetical protein [Oligosphaera ethanolica]
MDWTVGTFWTMGNDALDAGDRLWTAGTPGTHWRDGQDVSIASIKTLSVPPGKRRRWWPAVINGVPVMIFPGNGLVFRCSSCFWGYI